MFCQVGGTWVRQQMLPGRPQWVVQPCTKNATSSWLGWPAQSLAICDELRRSPPHAPGRPGYHLVAVPAMSPVGPPTPPGRRRGRPSPVQPSLAHRSPPQRYAGITSRRAPRTVYHAGCWPLGPGRRPKKPSPGLLLGLPPSPPIKPFALMGLQASPLAGR